MKTSILLQQTMNNNLFVFYNNIERFYGEILYMCCDTYGTYKTIFSSAVENIVSGSLVLEYFISRFIYIFKIKKNQTKKCLTYSSNLSYRRTYFMGSNT